MNTREALQALLDGKKIKKRDWKYQFLFLNEKGLLIDRNHLKSNFVFEDNVYEVYEEPKKIVKKKMYQYFFKTPNGNISMSTMLCESEGHFYESYPYGYKILNILKPIEHEIEVEDEL